MAKQCGIDLDRLPIVDAPLQRGVGRERRSQLVREGKAEALMKGSLHTDELMGAVVKRDTGLRTARRISHCFVMDVPSYAETLIVTDAAVNIAPTLEDKVDIIQNAIDLAHALRFPEVRVAILSAMETVNPKVPSTVEAAALCKMADRGQITGAILDGPLALDNAISLESAKIKKIDSPVAGRANVLVVPDLEAGNMLAKSLSFLAGADAAGIVLGARVPIILTSRADSVTTRLASCAVAALVAQARREAASQGGGVMSHGRCDRRPERRLVEHQVLAVRRRRARRSSSSRAARSKGSTPRRASSRRTGPAPSSTRSRGATASSSATTGALDYLGRLPARAADASTGSSASAIASCTAGSSTRSRCASTPPCVDGAREATFRSRRCTSRTTWRRSARCSSACRSCRRSPASTPRSIAAQPPVAQAFALPQSITERGVHPLRLPRPVVRIHRRRAAASTMRAPRPARSSCCTSATARACARWQAGAASRARWASPRSTACRWARAAATSTPASCST